MGSTTTNEAEVREILGHACATRELLILVTPYMRFESNFLLLEPDAFHVRVTMSAEEATYGLRSEDLRFRFPHITRFLEGRTRLLGFGLLEGRRTLRLAIPKALQDDDHRRAYRVERVGKVAVTFSTPKFDLRSGALANLSTTGARLISGQDALDPLLKEGDPIAVTIPLTEEIRINNPAVVRWVAGRAMGVEFQPSLAPDVLTPLSRWVFQKREEDKSRVSAIQPVSGAGPAQPGSGGLVLVSSSQELEDQLRDLLTGLPLLRRAGPTVPALKEVVTGNPALVLFHVPGAGLDERKRLKTLVEVLGPKLPFVLLGTQLEGSALFDLGSELKAAAVYDLGPKPGPFFPRLVQGILRRHQEGGEAPMAPKEG